MNKVALAVDLRSETGKGPARRLRAAGKTPAIFYGKKTEPLKLAVDVREFQKVLDEAGSNPLFDLKIRGEEGVSGRRALLKMRQVDPVDGRLVHLDFVEIFMDESVEVPVPVEFDGKPVGVELGGMFQVVTREIKVSCLPDNIPAVIVVDVSGLELGHSLHVGDITLPDGVTAVVDSNVVLATVASSKKAEGEVAPEEAAESTPAS